MKTSTHSSASRLRKSGLVRKAAVAALATTSALTTASAAVVYSGTLNTTVSGSNSVPVNIDGQGAPEFSMASSDGKSFTFHSLNSFSSGFQFLASSTSSQYPLRLSVDTPIGASGTFSEASNGGGNARISTNGITGEENWAPAASGFLGFSFDPSGNLPLYGWAQISIDPSGTVMTLVDFAYDDSGSSILAGTVPEPSSALLAAAGIGALCLRRKRRGDAPD